MSEHLTAEEIRDFCEHKIKGKARVRTLLHLESCGDCRSLTVAPNQTEIIQRLSSKKLKTESDTGDEDYNELFGQTSPS